MKDGRIVALQHDVDISGGDADGAGHAATEVAKNQTELYTSGVPHWKSNYCGFEEIVRRSRMPE